MTGLWHSPIKESAKYFLSISVLPIPSYFGLVWRKDVLFSHEADIDERIFCRDQNSCNSSALIFFIATSRAFMPPALVPINISNKSNIDLPVATSSCFKNTTPAIARTPPPSKDRTLLIFFVEKTSK